MNLSLYSFGFFHSFHLSFSAFRYFKGVLSIPAPLWLTSNRSYAAYWEKNRRIRHRILGQWRASDVNGLKIAQLVLSAIVVNSRGKQNWQLPQNDAVMFCSCWCSPRPNSKQLATEYIHNNTFCSAGKDVVFGWKPDCQKLFPPSP